MGFSTPQDAAPAYDDVVHNHPVNQYAPSGSASAYATVPQDDVELEAHDHEHGSSTPTPQPTETLAQTIVGAFRAKPHVHCKACDTQLEARMRRENQRFCCGMVALVFIILFICGVILGSTIVRAARARRHGLD